MPKGLQESQKLEKAIWTPSTKAEAGEHDENISKEQAVKIVGADVAEKVERVSLQLYEMVSIVLSLRRLNNKMNLANGFITCRLVTTLSTVVSSSPTPSSNSDSIHQPMSLCLSTRSSHLTARASGLQTPTKSAEASRATIRYVVA